MSLAARLKMARESLSYSQKEMADSISTNTRTWQIYEAGKSVPGGNVLEALSRLGFSVDWLLTGEGEMRRGEQERRRDTSDPIFHLEKMTTILRGIDDVDLEGIKLDYETKAFLAGITYNYYFDENEIDRETIKKFVTALFVITMIYKRNLVDIPKDELKNLAEAVIQLLETDWKGLYFFKKEEGEEGGKKSRKEPGDDEQGEK